MERIPPRGPVIIIANHPSSLMDAALLGILLKRPLWYFTRGDVFVNRPVRRLLSWLHMLPVHPHEKGRASLNANDDSFSEARRILARNGIIVFFPESTSHTERRLWAFRKGVFRLAFQTMADHDFLLRLPVVPIGISYDHPTSGRQCVQVHAGPPLYMDDYTALYQQNPSAALLRIAKDAQDRMANEVLHIDDGDRCATADQCLVLHRNDHQPLARSWHIASRAALEGQQSVCVRVNEASDTTWESIKERNAAYFEGLQPYGLKEETVAGVMHASNRPTGAHWRNSLRLFLLWISSPLYLIGLLLNGLPIWIARRIADKKVTRADFYSWIFVSCYCLLYSLWMIVLIVVAGLLHLWYIPILIVAMASTGLFSYTWLGWRRQAKQDSIIQNLPEEVLIKIIHLRKAAAGLSFF